MTGLVLIGTKPGPDGGLGQPILGREAHDQIIQIGVRISHRPTSSSRDGRIALCDDSGPPEMRAEAGSGPSDRLGAGLRSDRSVDCLVQPLGAGGLDKPPRHLHGLMQCAGPVDPRAGRRTTPAFEAWS